MPNRIIKESIKKSPTIDQLKPFEEIVFYRIIVTADDYGRLDGRSVVLKNELFPTKEDVTKKSIEDAIARLVQVDLVRRYEIDGVPYLYMPTWELHQRVRNKKSKYPDPPVAHLSATCCQLTADCGSNPIQSESKSEIESNTKPEAETAPACSSAVITLTLNDKSEYPVYQQQVEEWAELYPAVDVMQSLRDMKGWIQANPTNRKTKSGILRFITGWLSKNQNQGGAKGGTHQQRDSATIHPAGNPSADRPKYGTVLD